MPVIALLDTRPPDTMTDRLRAFRQGLKDGGYVEGENVAIEYRSAEGHNDQLPALAAELVRPQFRSSDNSIVGAICYGQIRQGLGTG